MSAMDKDQSAAAKAAARAVARAHERARLLASYELDEQLSPADTIWLAVHLRGCAACQSVADEYRLVHNELRGLAAPEPPRDLWARTSAGLDAVDRQRAGRSGLTRLASQFGLQLRDLVRTRPYLASVTAVAVVVLVVALSLSSQGTLFAPPVTPSSATNVAIASAAASGGQAALAVVGGTSYYVASDNGVYQIKGGSAHCTGSPESCAVTNVAGTVLGSVTSKTVVSVVIAPNANNAAVWNSNKIVILPLGGSTPKTVAIDQLTPRPTTAAAAVAATTAAVATPSVSVEPEASPSDTPQPTASPTPALVVATAATAIGPQPTAILDGYRVVGRAPEFSANGQWVAFSARSVNASSGSDVFVWRVGWAQAEAVTASHADLFAGWFGQRILVSEFSQPVSAPTPTPDASSSAAEPTSTAAVPALAARPPVIAISYVYDPMTAAVEQIDRPMLMPVVDPTGHFVVYWSGTVAFDQASGLYGAGQGGFYFDTWSDLDLIPAQLGGGGGQPVSQPTAVPTPSPSAAQPTDGASPLALSDGSNGGLFAVAAGQPVSPADAAPALPQLVPVDSARGTVTSWSVRWDATGQYVAIWVASPGAGDIGQVSLFNVIPGSNLLNVGGLLLSASARSNIQFDDSQFVYTSPGRGGADGMTYLFQLPAIPPGPAATPALTMPGPSFGSGQSDGTAPAHNPTDSSGG